jgi:hypothetical protein
VAGVVFRCRRVVRSITIMDLPSSSAAHESTADLISPAASSDVRVSVAFVGGHGRSGSTLLSRVLGQVPGFVSVGELRYLWRQGVRRGAMCGCGRPFHHCRFWRKVGKEAFGGWRQIDVREVVKLQRSIERNRYLPLLVHPHLTPGFERRLRRYAEIMSVLYRAIQTVSGCDVIVDSSKFPSSAYVLPFVPHIEPRLIHLVRSSHGVCYSWTKTIVRADRGGSLMARHGPARSAMEWVGFNFALDLLSTRGMASTLVRYEDFIAHPRRETRRILAFLGEERDPSELKFLTRAYAKLPAEHGVAGNPMRLRVGKQRLELDEEWRTGFPLLTRRLVTTLTAPGLVRYGYPLTVKPRRAED